MLDFTPQERLALGVVTLLLVAGGWVRWMGASGAGGAWLEAGAPAADTPSIGGSALRAEVEREVAREAVRGAPLRPGERLDPNRASADELDRLPRVGPALARRMVEHREANGPYRTLADLDAVPGVGPALLGSLAPHLVLSPAPAAAPAARALDLNRATAGELEALPGVGPVLAERIVAWRRENGPFRQVAELERVPGIGPALLARLAPHLRVP